MSLLCPYYVADLMQKLELCLTVVLVLLKLGHGQISEPKIGIPMLKITSIDPLLAQVSLTIFGKNNGDDCGGYFLEWASCIAPLNLVQIL